MSGQSHTANARIYSEFRRRERKEITLWTLFSPKWLGTFRRWLFLTEIDCLKKKWEINLIYYFNNIHLVLRNYNINPEVLKEYPAQLWTLYYCRWKKINKYFYLKINFLYACLVWSKYSIRNNNKNYAVHRACASLRLSPSATNLTGSVYRDSSQKGKLCLKKRNF